MNSSGMERIAKVEPLTKARSLRGPFDYRLPRHMEDVAVGSLLVVPFGRQRLHGVVVELATKSEVPAERLAEPIKALGEGVPAGLVKLALAISNEYCSTPARCLKLVMPPGTGFAPGNSNVAGPKRRQAHSGKPSEASVGHSAKIESLTAAQRKALESIQSSIRAGDGQEGRCAKFLLNGVTGSGKTEVYLRAAEAVLESGRTAIVLVPEIALTPQTLGRFKSRLGDAVAVLHSKLGQGERYDEWQRLKKGEARVCVGPRSAVFAPLESLGLIVIDEEHDASYKQEADPRYDARLVAEWRAERSGAVLIAGSATPRPESWLKYQRLDLPSRVDERPLPHVAVLDMRGQRTGLHPETKEALLEVARAGQKAIVLLNRRGWSNFLVCRVCGHVQQCTMCDVTLTLHGGSGGRLVCHHCGLKQDASSICPSCNSPSVARYGIGTERLEQELKDVVTSMPVFRLDADTTRAKGSILRVLEAFDSSPSGILVGTQMVAKGHDFPEVTLGVVLDADATLRFPDFRSEERTFALIAQLAGRSGRGPGGGRVLVQTVSPEAGCIQHAANHDSAGFLEGEIERRKVLNYPPFGELARAVCSSPDTATAQGAASELAVCLGATGVDVLGPAELFRLKGHRRFQLLAKASERDKLVAGVNHAVAEIGRGKLLKGVKLSVDIDPQ